MENGDKIFHEPAELEGELTPERTHDPTELISEEIKKRNGKVLIAFGESSHHADGVLAYETELIENLQKGHTIRDVFLEEDSGMMDEVRRYYRDGVMSATLRNYLTHGFVRQDTDGHEYKLKLVEKCRELGIPVTFIDKNDLPDRDTEMTQAIAGRIGEHMDGLYIAIAGRNHMSHTKKVYVPNGHTPFVAQLDKKYPEQVVSLQCQISYPDEFDAKQEELESTFIEDLGRLGRLQLRSAVRVKDSPYAERPLRSNRAIPARTGEAFDILINVPGKSLEKYG